MNELIIGRRGLGKSTLAKHEADVLNRNQIFFDPGAQFAHVDFASHDIKLFFDELTDHDDRKPFVFAYVPEPGNVEARWDAFADKLWEFTGQHEGGASYVLIIDEAHRLQSPQKINDWLDEFIRRSPRRERGDKNPVDIIQTTHYPQDLNRISWGESDKILFFNLFHHRAVEAVRDQFGDDVAYTVQQLRTPKSGNARDVLIVDSETRETILVDNERVWYSDIRQPKNPDDEVPGIREASAVELEQRYGKF